MNTAEESRFPFSSTTVKLIWYSPLVNWVTFVTDSLADVNCTVLGPLNTDRLVIDWISNNWFVPCSNRSPQLLPMIRHEFCVPFAVVPVQSRLSHWQGNGHVSSSISCGTKNTMMKKNSPSITEVDATLSIIWNSTLRRHVGRRLHKDSNFGRRRLVRVVHDLEDKSVRPLLQVGKLKVRRPRVLHVHSLVLVGWALGPFPAGDVMIVAAQVAVQGHRVLGQVNDDVLARVSTGWVVRHLQDSYVGHCRVAHVVRVFHRQSVRWTLWIFALEWKQKVSLTWRNSYLAIINKKKLS